MLKARFKHYAFFFTCVSLVTLVIISGLYLFLNAVPACAATQTNRWNNVSIPAEGEAGGWVLAPGSDIKLIAAAPDGTLYAYAAGLSNTLLKSDNGGLRWSATGNVQATITAIAVSAHDSKIIYYATETAVYRSADAGKTFFALPQVPGTSTPCIKITSLAADSGFVAAATKNTASFSYGGVYLLDESSVVPSWADTGIGNYDVYAIALPPDYTAYRQIIAAGTDETDSWVFNKFGNADWNTLSSPAKLTQETGELAAITRSAAIALPEDYSSAMDSGRIFYVGTDTGAGNGDIYKVSTQDDASVLTVQRLNAAGVPTRDFTSLAVHKENTNTVILAGATDGQIYTSTDDGVTWGKNRKAPTGNADACVLLPPSFSTSHTMYAATTGQGSAVSISRDAGLTWNQISLVDGIIANLTGVIASPDFKNDKTLFLNTYGSGPGSGSLWRTEDGGENWERILSGDNPGVVTLSQISLPPPYGLSCRTIFIAGLSINGPAVWSSDDNGQSFRVRQTFDTVNRASFPIDLLISVDKDNFFVTSHDAAHGLVFHTANKGMFYSPAATAGNGTICSLALSPDFLNDGIIVAGSSNGAVYYSADSGTSFSALPFATETGILSGQINVVLAPDFPKSRQVFACSNTGGAGLFRFTVNESEEWQSIDTTLPGAGVINDLAITAKGSLYAINGKANGGMERCLDASGTGPEFETVTRGLSAGAILSGFSQSGDCLWAIDTANNKLMAYEDTLTLPVSLLSPSNNVSGLGSLADHNVKNIIIDWEPAPGATGYEWQCALDGDFSNIPAGFHGTTSSTTMRLPTLEPSTMYSWRVRVSSPSSSPWSEKRIFSTTLDTRVIELQPESPSPGSSDVPIEPVFQWTAVVGASFYELLVAEEVNFENPVITKTDAYALPSNVWECDVRLDNDATYYWKVRALSGGSYSPWSATGVFTTASLELPPGHTTTTLPEARLLGKTDLQMNLNPMSKTPIVPAPAETDTITVPAPIPGGYQLSAIPDWLVGGLLVITVLSLVIILAVVIKIKRF